MPFDTVLPVRIWECRQTAEAPAGFPGAEKGFDSMQAPSPREEISRTLPFVPVGIDTMVLAQDSATRQQMVKESLSALQNRADGGDKSAAAALAIAGGNADAALAALGRSQGEAGSMLPDRSAVDGAPIAGLYGEALEADSDAREDDAALLLAILAGTAAGAHDGMLGLAVLALRRNLIDEAICLVATCLAAEPIHPRAGSIFAICELERGRAASGQAYLAAACRHARRVGHFRSELQLAQRALLLMHLS